MTANQMAQAQRDLAEMGWVAFDGLQDLQDFLASSRLLLQGKVGIYRRTGSGGWMMEVTEDARKGDKT